MKSVAGFNKHDKSFPLSTSRSNDSYLVDNLMLFLPVICTDAEELLRREVNGFNSRKGCFLILVVFQSAYHIKLIAKLVGVLK